MPSLSSFSASDQSWPASLRGLAPRAPVAASEGPSGVAVGQGANPERGDGDRYILRGGGSAPFGLVVFTGLLVRGQRSVGATPVALSWPVTRRACSGRSDSAEWSVGRSVMVRGSRRSSRREGGWRADRTGRRGRTRTRSRRPSARPGSTRSAPARQHDSVPGSLAHATSSLYCLVLGATVRRAQVALEDGGHREPLDGVDGLVLGTLADQRGGDGGAAA